MTRFQRELSGELGEFWKKEAEKQLDKVRAELAEGKISIDAEGVARNCIGRVLMDDLLEQLGIATDKQMGKPLFDELPYFVFNMVSKFVCQFVNIVGGAIYVQHRKIYGLYERDVRADG